MTFREEIKNLFDVQITEIDDDGYYLVHCISADFAFESEVSKEIDKRFGMRESLNVAFPTYMNIYMNNYMKLGVYGDCILCGEVFSLITKERRFHTPSLRSLEMSLQLMRRICKECHIKKVAMQRQGCMFDNLDWDKVKLLIQNVFEDTDIEILVCVQQ